MQGMETKADTPDDKPDQEPGTDPITEAVEAEEGAEEQVEQDPIDDVGLELEDATEDRIQGLVAENADLKDKLLRALAESENVRRRAERDKTDAQRFAVTKFARDLVGVADNLNRALKAVDEEARKTNEALENLCVGIEMTEKELSSAFKAAGIKALDPVGEAFDPHAHEALFEIEDASKPAGTVLQVIETGYMLDTRTLRPAKVGIAKGGPKTPANKPAADSDKKQETEAQKSDGQKTYEQKSDQEKGQAGGNLDEEL